MASFLNPSPTLSPVPAGAPIPHRELQDLFCYVWPIMTDICRLLNQNKAQDYSFRRDFTDLHFADAEGIYATASKKSYQDSALVSVFSDSSAFPVIRFEVSPYGRIENRFFQDLA